MFDTTRRIGRNSSRRGAAATEYALVLALIVGGLLIGAHQLSDVQREAFGQLAETAEFRGPVGRNTGVERTRLARTQPKPTPVARVMQYADHRVGAVLLVAGALGLGILWTCRWRRRAAERRAAPEPVAAPGPLQTSVFEKRQLILRVLSKEQRLSADRIQIRHVMTSDTVRVRPQAALAEVRQLMHDKALRHVLVCDPRGALLGVVSDRDLLTRRGKTAGDVMSTHPVTVGPESLVVPSITWMINQHISCLPVVSENRVVGVVTTTDLLLTLQCSLQLLEHPDDPQAEELALAHAIGGC